MPARPSLLLAVGAGLLMIVASTTSTALPSGTTAVVGATRLAAVRPVTMPQATPQGSTRWIRRIRELVGSRPMSVAIGNDGETWFGNDQRVSRPPASNQKLLLSMALLQRFSLERTIPTRAMATTAPENGVLHGSLWVVGAGDPEVAAPRIRALARRLVAAGLRRIRGRVMGATTPFVRDWWAKGWRDYFPSVYAPIPTALTFRGNDVNGRHVADPERLAARDLLRRLERLGVEATRGADMARAPSDLRVLAQVRSEPLIGIMRRMNVASSNLRAEVLGKVLGRDRYRQASIDGGARAIESFVRARGFDVTAYDSSGLSYANRARAATILRLLWYADGRAWGDELRETLPMGGRGTLEGRLESVLVHAKTGTLIDVSALSGWVWLERSQEWAEFSILSSGIRASTAKSIEDRIVRIVANSASDPGP